VPRRWSDLRRPEYRGRIGISDPRSSGTGLASLVAAAFALGGSEDDISPGLELFRRLREAGNLAAAEGDSSTLEKGEIPIQIKYDFNAIADRDELADKGIEAEVVIPGDGSIYAPSALLSNGYYEPQAPVRAFMEYVLSDEAQLIFARFGARPIRYVTGGLELPASARENWLPDVAYERVQTIEDWSKLDPDGIADRWETEVLG
jgi:putative spermidine/putrescine transport system substrate-binding protein